MKRIMQFLKYLINEIDGQGNIRYFINKSGNRISIPIGSMTGSGLSRYLQEIAKDKLILEFGSGGSTILFGKVGKRAISVESDRYFAQKVTAQLESLGLNQKATVRWANIGPTKSYGQPLGTTLILFRHTFPRYSQQIFDSLMISREADLVFIDGRFRVACAMSSLLNIKGNFIMVVDDFFDRQYYSPITEVIGEPILRIENTAVFEINKLSVDEELIQRYLSMHEYDYR